MERCGCGADRCSLVLVRNRAAFDNFRSDRDFVQPTALTIVVGKRKTAHGPPSFPTCFNNIPLFGTTSLPFRFLLRCFTSCGADLFPLPNVALIFFFTEQTRSSRKPLFLRYLFHGGGVCSSLDIGVKDSYPDRPMLCFGQP